MIIRIYYKKLGGHYHCRVFTSKAKNMTFGKAGDLVFDEYEWNDIRNMLHSACEFVPEEISGETNIVRQLEETDRIIP